MAKSNSLPSSGHYDANYENFQTELYAKIRSEAFGEDIGQNSWLTVDEHDRFLEWLALTPEKVLLDVACGAGGPALRIAAITGCSVVGIDAHEDAITTAKALASTRKLAERTHFLAGDATVPLPFSDSNFDAITCIDAINHFPERPRIMVEWARLLKPEGRLLFTDPLTITGPLTNSEVAVRSLAGFCLFVPHGYDERVMAQCGFSLLMCEDVTGNMASVAQARHTARKSRRTALCKIEGDREYERQQEFLLQPLVWREKGVCPDSSVFPRKLNRFRKGPSSDLHELAVYDHDGDRPKRCRSASKTASRIPTPSLCLSALHR